MRRRQRNFAETGAASSIISLSDDLGLGFVGGSQLDITPFQRQMFEAEKARQAEAQQEQRAKAQSGGGGGGRTPNSMNTQSPPASSGRSQSETVRYISEGDGGTADDNGSTLSVID